MNEVISFTPQDRKPVLITGAAGSIGQHLLKRFAGTVPTLAGYRNEKDREQLKNISPNVIPVKLEMTDPESLIQATENVGTVINAAAILTLEQFSVQTWEVNAWGVENLVYAARQNGVSKIIHLSTVGVYGLRDEKEERGEVALDEAAILNPGNAYGKSKTIAEEILFDTSNTVNTVAIRPANVIGEVDIWTSRIFEILSKSYPVPLLNKILNLLERSLVPTNMILSDGTFNYTDVESLVDGVVLAGMKDEANGEIFNIVDGVTSWDEIMTKHGEIIGRKPWGPPISSDTLHKAADVVTFIADRIGKESPLTSNRVRQMTSRVIYSNEKAKNVLGFTPRPLDQTLERIANWQRNKIPHLQREVTSPWKAKTRTALHMLAPD